jgi:two-component system cell cycle response regulator
MSEDIEILIVEDSLVQAAYLQEVLEQHSYDVSVAHNGKEALASIEKHNPSIVISDIIMPEMDGYELCRRIKADENLKHIPIILLTQLSDPGDIIGGLECGAANFVTKPYSEEFLLSRIHHILMTQELRKSVITEEAIDIFFANRKYSITSGRMQILDLLLSTYEAAVQKNQELEQANEELRKALETIGSLEANHHTLLERNADAIVVVDQHGIMRFVNPAAEALFGRKAQELLGELFDFPVVAGQTTEVSVIRSSGEAAVVEMRVVETNWEGEDACLASLRDITQRKRTEEALRESVEREAQAYAQGRLEIVDTILHNIGNALNSVTIGIGTIQENLMNNRLMSHFRSLANAIEEHQDDFIDYIKNDPQGQKVAPFIVALADDFAKQGEELAKTVSRVRERAEHIADIIRTEKTLSRRSVYRKDVNLREAIDNAITVLQDSIGKRDIEISIDQNNAPKEISTQESQFHQMLVNLIKNSIEAIDDLRASEGLDGTPFIKIECYVESDSFILEVTDNGIGVEKDKLDAIFRSGYTTKDSGSGLGLHSIANFVSGCGGQIQALSDGIGKGATMQVALPLSY